MASSSAGQPSISNVPPAGNIADPGDQQPPPTMYPLSGVIITDGNDPVSATLTLNGNAIVSDPGQMSQVPAPNSPPTRALYQSATVNPLQLSTILSQIQLTPLPFYGGYDGKFAYQGRISISLDVTDQKTGKQTSTSMSYQEIVPQNGLSISGAAPTSVDYGGAVHPFAGVNITDTDIDTGFPSAAFGSLVVGATITINGWQSAAGGSIVGSGVETEPGKYVIPESMTVAQLNAALQVITYQVPAQSTSSLPSPVTLTLDVGDNDFSSASTNVAVTEAAPPTPPSPPVPPPSPPSVTEVTQFYQDILQRSPDPGGLAYWTGQINGGALSAAAVEQNIINSSEAQDYVVPIVEMYAILGRAPDQAGLNGWVHAIEGGASLPGVALAFISSPEGQGIYGVVPTATSSAAADTTFTADLYKEILGRAPDAGGLSWWVTLLQDGLPAQYETLGFMYSPEAQHRFFAGSDPMDSWLRAADSGTFASHFSFGSG